MSWLWWIALIVGPILLFAVIIWGVVRTHTSTRNVPDAERGAKELREELARKDEV